MREERKGGGVSELVGDWGSFSSTPFSIVQYRNGNEPLSLYSVSPNLLVSALRTRMKKSHQSFALVPSSRLLNCRQALTLDKYEKNDFIIFFNIFTSQIPILCLVAKADAFDSLWFLMLTKYLLKLLVP